MTRTCVSGLVLVVCALASGCGAPLVDGHYDGVPIARFRVGVGPPAGTDLSRMRIGLFFAPDRLEQLDDPAALVELADSSSPLANGDMDFGIYDQPGPERSIRDGAGVPLYAAARLMVYVDANGNHRRDPDERIAGAETRKVWIFAPNPLPPEISPTRRVMPAGVHDMIVPLQCGNAPAPQYGDTDCGVPLGNECANSAGCGSGICVEAMAEVFPGGVCTLLDGPSTCKPRGGIRRVQPLDTGVIWLKACERDADCGRNRPWRCDLAIGGCYPADDTRIEFFSSFRMMPACPR